MATRITVNDNGVTETDVPDGVSTLPPAIQERINNDGGGTILMASGRKISKDDIARDNWRPAATLDGEQMVSIEPTGKSLKFAELPNPENYFIDPNTRRPDKAISLVTKRERDAELSKECLAKGGDDEGVSAARRRLNRLRAGKLAPDEKPVETVEFQGEKFFIKRLNFSEITRAHMMSGRKSDGSLDIENSDDDVRNLCTGALLTAIVTDEIGDTPYFTLGDVIEYVQATDPETFALVAFLSTVAMKVNPALNPTFVRGVAIIPEASHAQSKVTSDPTTTSTSTTQEDSLTEMDSTSQRLESPAN